MKIRRKRKTAMDVIQEYRKGSEFDTLGQYTGVPVEDERQLGVTPVTNMPTQDVDDL